MTTARDVVDFIRFITDWSPATCATNEFIVSDEEYSEARYYQNIGLMEEMEDSHFASQSKFTLFRMTDDGEDIYNTHMRFKEL